MTSAPSLYSALGLSRNPFPPTPDAGSYFFTPKLEEDFAEIVHCVEARKGFVLLTGEVGLGKSTMVRRLLDTLHGKNCRSALILNTFLQDGALLSAIQTDFGLAPADSVEQGLARLTEFLIERHNAGDTSLLVIDDAQNLTVQSLELVRLLCNLETGQEKLLQILLVGQPELEQTLARPELRQLKSRIVKHARLTGLQKAELARYFDFRVNAANGEGRLSIEAAAVDVLYRYTQGNVRQVHLVLDRCLYGLASTRGSVVNAALVELAVADLPDLAADPPSGGALTMRAGRRKAWVAAGALAGVTATVAAAWGFVFPPGASVDAGRPIATSASAVRQHATPAPAVATAAGTGVATATANATASAVTAGPVAEPSEATPLQKCEQQLRPQATADEALQVQRVPASIQASLRPSSRVCRFAVGDEMWVAWISRGEARHIAMAQQATRGVQTRLRAMGFMDPRDADDGLFGPKTGEALARFQQQRGLPVTGKPDEFTFFLLEHQDVSAR